IRVGQVRLPIVHVTANPFEDDSLAVDDLPDARVQREAKIPPPRNPNVTEVAIERLREDRAGVTDGDRRSRIAAGHRAQQQRHVSDGPRYRPFDAECGPPQKRWPYWHSAGRRPQADDTAEARRIPERAAHVGAV